MYQGCLVTLKGGTASNFPGVGFINDCSNLNEVGLNTLANHPGYIVINKRYGPFTAGDVMLDQVSVIKQKEDRR